MSRNIKPEDRVEPPESDETGENTNPLRDTDHTNGGGETDISGLLVGVRNETTFYVGNAESGTAYLVNMCDPEHEDEMTCTCPDYRYRASPDEDGACKHILAVIDHMPADVGIEQVAYDGLKRQYDILDSKVNQVMKDLSNVQANVHADTGSESETRTPTQEQYVDAGDAAGNGQEMASVSAEEAASKLQDAFNAVVDGFDVQAHNGKVWVNKTPTAPETLPGPGKVDTFTALVSGPQEMKYDPDADSPGQYFNNVIEPNDVDSYISEVLE